MRAISWTQKRNSTSYSLVVSRIDLVPPAANVIELFEDACADLGLKAHRGTLSKYPESTHWHITLPRSKGTLEATWWPTNHVLWLEVRNHRSADWMPAAIAKLVEEF